MSYDAIDAYVEKQMRRLHVPGVSLAIVEGDQVVHLRGLGRARPGGQAPTPHTPFAVGSITKSFTALAIMQLVEAGKVHLDDPVQRCLPWFRVADPQASAQMTVLHLLTHTSGLPLWTGEIFEDDFDAGPGAAERHARGLSTVALARPVGSAFEYSNANYHLLGLIIEAASGESYADYVQKHIFTPLRMSHSYTALARAKQDGLAVGHRYWFMIPVPAPGMRLPPGGLAGGGLFSSAADMAHYLIAQLNGGRYEQEQILSSAGIDELHRAAVQVGPEAVPADLGPARTWFRNLPLGQYALGWSVDRIGGTRVVSHGGTLPHFAAYMALLPEQKKALVLLFNVCHHWMNPVFTEVGMGATALLAGNPPASGPVSRVMPWLLRSPLLIPAVQLVEVVASLRLFRRWRLDPERRPGSAVERLRHILLPLIPNLLVALNLVPMMDKRRGYRLLYKPDSSWIVLLCGSLALLWSIVRTALVFSALRRKPPHE